MCRDEGIDVVTNAHIAQVDGKSGEWVKLHGTCNGTEITLEGSHVLVASGRKANTENIGLELAGVELTDRGYVKVNERLQTTAPGIWAAGDCAGSPHFTHISFDDFRIVVSNLTGGHRVTTGRQVPFCMFTDPEFARIGLSESEAKARGIPYRLAKIPMIADLRTRTLSETRGFMKALIAMDSDQILGFTMFGVMAGEVMATVQVAMQADVPYTALRDTIFTHPTMLEGLVSMFSAVPARATFSFSSFPSRRCIHLRVRRGSTWRDDRGPSVRQRCWRPGLSRDPARVAESRGSKRKSPARASVP